MAISKDKKATLVAGLTDLLSNAQMVVFAEYHGLTVKDLELLRKLARESDVKIKIIKNRLVQVAMKNTSTFKNAETSPLTGQLLYAIGSDEDFASAKVLAKFAKTHATLKLMGGFNATGESLSQDEVNALGALPTKNELIAQIIDTLLSSVNSIVSGLEQQTKVTA